MPEELSDLALEAKLFAAAGTKQGHRRQVEPDWASIQRELKRKHVTLALLSHEYIERNPEGYRYSRFCDLYRGWERKLSVTMRQTHVGGDKLFVDYAGDTVPVIVDRLTGEEREAQIFVAVMGASNFTYAEATWTQGLGRLDRGPHARLRSRSAACRVLLVPDNAKVAVITRPVRTSRQVNRTYAEMAAHYGTAVAAGAATAGRATRRAFHTAPHSDYCAVIRSSRAGCGRRPPWPLMIFRLGGMSQSPRRRRSE